MERTPEKALRIPKSPRSKFPRVALSTLLGASILMNPDSVAAAGLNVTNIVERHEVVLMAVDVPCTPKVENYSLRGDRIFQRQIIKNESGEVVSVTGNYTFMMKGVDATTGKMGNMYMSFRAKETNPSSSVIEGKGTQRFVTTDGTKTTFEGYFTHNTVNNTIDSFSPTADSCKDNPAQ